MSQHRSIRVHSPPPGTAASLAALERVVVIGNSSAGKSTLARTLAARLDCPHIELDALHWLNDWVARELPDFAHGVSGAIAAPNWVADGNYSQVRDLVWARSHGDHLAELPLSASSSGEP